MSVLSAIVLGAVVASGVAGCASRDDASAADGAVQDQPFRELGYGLRWILPDALGSGEAPKSMRSLEGGGLAVVDQQNTLSLIDPATGGTRWRASLGNPLLRFAGIDANDSILVAVMQTDLQAFSLNSGELLQRHQLGVQASTPPILGPNQIVVGSSSGRIIAVDLVFGFRNWAYDLEGAINADLVRVRSAIGAVSRSGDVAILSEDDGASAGRRLEMFAGAATDPVSDGERVYVASLDQSIYALSGFPDEGRVWRVRTQFPIRSQPAVDEGRLYIDLPERGFTALDAGTGEELWRIEALSGEAIARMQGLLAVWDGSSIHLVRPAEGTIARSVALPGVSSIVTNAFADPDLYVLFEDGTIERHAPNF